MRTKKMCAALAAVMLATAMVIGCGMPPIETTDGYTPPEGMGVIRVNFDSEIARATILPKDGVIGDFKEFEITFTQTGTPNGAVSRTVHQTPTATVTPTGTAAAMGTAVELNAGNYTMTVVGYLTAGTGNRDANGIPATASAGAAATATIADGITNVSGATPIAGGVLVVANGSNNPVDVKLHAYDPDGSYNPLKTGTFAWDITDSLSGTLTAPSEMTIYRLNDTTQEGSTVNLLTPGNWNDSVSLPAGFYHVNFTLQMGTGAGIVIRTFRHVLHVYENLTSTFEYEFTDLHISIVSTSVKPTITYDAPVDYYPIVSVVTGGTGTYTGTGQINLTTFVINPLKVEDGSGTIWIQVTNAADVDGNSNPYTGITWLYAGGSLAAQTWDDKVATGLDDTLILDTSDAPFDTLTVGAPYQLAVTGIYGGKEYTTEIYIQIVAP